MRLTLGVLLVVVMACATDSPEPTPFAPDDLASVLPRRVGDIALDVDGTGGSDVLVTTLGRDVLIDYLHAVNDDQRQRAASGSDNLQSALPDDVRFAVASGVDETTGQRLVIYAARVDGVEAGVPDLSFMHSVSPPYPAERPTVTEVSRGGMPAGG